MATHLSENAKHAADALSIATVLATLAEWLPAAAALASLIWSLLRIYETKTVREWLGKKPVDE